MFILLISNIGVSITVSEVYNVDTLPRKIGRVIRVIFNFIILVLKAIIKFIMEFIDGFINERKNVFHKRNRKN